MNFPILLLLLLCSLSACKSSIPNNTIDTPATVVEDALKEAPPTPITRQINSTEITKKAVATFQEKYGAQYDAIAYNLLVDNAYYFVVVQGDWSLNKQTKEQSKQQDRPYKMGLVTADNQVVIPIEFDKIYNLGATASSLFEVETKGKRGLYDLNGKVLLTVTYNGLYPAKKSPNVWAYWRQGNQFGALYGNGETRQLPKQPEALLKHWNFDAEQASLIPFINVDALLASEDEDKGIGVLVFPSYLYELGIVPEYNTSWVYDVGSVGMKNTQASIQSLPSTTPTLFTALDQSFVAARSYHEAQQSVVTVNQYYQPVDSILLQTLEHQPICRQPAQVRLVSSDTLEVVQVQHTPEAIYEFQTVRRYYHIQADGQLKTLPTKGRFAMSQYILLQPEHLEGCFGRPMNEAEFEALSEDIEASHTVTQHLSVEDIDWMRNEIYARHGYKFKNKKWQTIFGKQSWYHATEDDVKSLLSPTESHNAQFLLDFKETMKEQEKELLQVRYEMANMAG